MTTRAFSVSDLFGKVTLLCLVMLFLPAVTQGSGIDAPQGNDNGREKHQAAADSPSLNTARACVISEDLDQAVSEYSLLLKRAPADAVMTSEYAYALALNGIYDAALARLDRVWVADNYNDEVNYFASQVFALMGYTAMADELVRRTERGQAPSWIASAAPSLLEKYMDRSPGKNPPDGGDVVTTFRRANRLAAQNYNLMAVAAFEGIIAGYPGEYLPYLGYSIALEKAGLYVRSAQTLQQAYELVKDKPGQTEAETMIEQRLTQVNNRQLSPAQKGNAEIDGLKPSQGGRRMLAYAGGMFSKSFISINGRFGTFISEGGSLSADLGIAKSGGSTSLNLGVMNYYRQKVFVAGYGLNAGLANSGSAFNFKISVGLSFMNKGRTSSWDIFLDGQQPIAPKGSATTLGMSVGRSVYFGTR